LAQGFVEEVQGLYQRGDLTELMPSMRAVGYRQVWAYLQGFDDFDTMTEKAIIATRQLAKRQFTWLRRVTDAISLESRQENVLPDVIAFVKAQRFIID